MHGKKQLLQHIGSKIASSFMERHTDIGFIDLIKIPHQTIFNESIV